MWHKLYSSVIGTSHLRKSISCQDYCNYKTFNNGDEEFLIIGISDGAGSAIHSKLGAIIAVENIISNILSSKIDISYFDVSYAKEMIGKTTQLLSNIAAENRINLKEFSCTLLVAFLSSKASVFFQIGDGAWVIKTDEGTKAITWPHIGEFANETVFITSPDMFEYLQFIKVTEPIFAVAGFTDGLQSLILDFSIKAPHKGFFEPIFNSFFNLSDDLNLTENLRMFLNSEKVNNRTDDDKTIFFAWRDFNK
ncbi:MAG TPA: PP2C family serine/threonine-protein phosphatase [bacterium]|nr:PP2C family serine/threonine-protein phosphatase [bacterium]HPN44959.1 PP2C family serine/threonine-protein phosphatase [bacterium]